jgi:hypothetical protein
MQSKSWVGAWLLGCAVTAGAQAPADEAPQPPALAAEASLPQAMPWAVAVNRRIQLSGALLNSHYRERDTTGLTPDGVLNTEQGHIRGNGLAVRWQGATPWLPVAPRGLWVEWSYQHLSGRTRYQGYLQQGNALTPYSAKTGNAYNTWQLRIGVPLTGLPAAEQVQWVPYLEHGQQRWQRNLVQYSETFRYRWWAAGLLVQWRPPKIQQLTFEFDATAGRHSHTLMRVPAMDFAADLPTKPLYHLGASATYQIQSHWGLTAGWQLKRTNSGPSEVIGGFREPPSKSNQQLWLLGLSFYF